MKKLLALLLAAVLMLGVLPCAMAEEELEEYRVTVLRSGNINEPFSTDDTVIGQILYDKFKIAFDYLPFTGDWTEYCALRLAGGDYPEIMQIDNAQIAQAYIDAGALLSFDDYADLLPDFFAYCPEYAYEDARSVAADGKMYFYQDVGALPATSNPGMAFIVRSDLLEEQGWPYVFTASEWLDFFKTAKENHPTTAEGLETFVNLPLGEGWGYNTMFNNTASPNSDHIKKIDYSTYSVVDTWDDFEMREFMEFWNAMWRENLLDPESFTDMSDQMVAKANTTQSLAGWYARWMYSGTNQSFIDAGTPEYEYVEMPFRIDSMVDEPLPMKVSGGTMVLGFGDKVITKNCKYPERIMELLNYLYSEEGRILHNWGIEGEDWYTDPETGLRNATPELVDLYLNHAEEYKARGINMFMSFGLTLGQETNQHDLQPGCILYSDAIQQVAYTDRELEAADKIAGQALPWDLFKDGVLPCGWEFVDDKGINAAMTIPSSDDDLIDIQQDIMDYTYSMIPKIIMAESDEEFDALYEECVAIRKEKGEDILIEWLNEQCAAAVEAYDAAN